MYFAFDVWSKPHGLGVFALWLIASIGGIVFSIKIKEVELGDGSLKIGNFRSSIEVPLGQVVEVLSRRTGVSRIVLRFSAPTKFGQSICFITRNGKHSETLELLRSLQRESNQGA